MRTATYALILLTSLPVPGLADEPKRTPVPLFEGLGPHSRKIETKQPKAQQYFDQGLMFLFAFNHDEAIRAFRQAAELDPECAMAYWGIALANGVHYNDPRFPPEKRKVSSDALAQARARAAGEAAAHQALIGALAERYPEPAPKEQA